MRDTYKVVPSDFALSEEDAIKRAEDRFGIDSVDGKIYREGCDGAGICYQGDYGQTYYIDFED